MRLRARGMIDTLDSPARAGSDFADNLLNENIDWIDLTIQVTGIPSTVLTSAFWDGFTNQMLKEAPLLFPDVQKVVWICDHDFQEDMINEHLR